MHPEKTLKRQIEEADLNKKTSDAAAVKTNDSITKINALRAVLAESYLQGKEGAYEYVPILSPTDATIVTSKLMSIIKDL